MVRSTGKEDSTELANAGGNESIANVKADINSINKAMILVMQSYFSEKSFSQRIAAKEKENSLLGDLFLPVLLQFMIGEKPEQIPTSGVIFSRESLGNTPGVVMINSCFGHGEAVVNSIYPADTYFIGSSKFIHPIIRIKHTRLVPKDSVDQEFKLVPETNNVVDQRRSSLTKSQIINLAKIAEHLEKDRKQPVDIEFVILNNQIYIVQVRPLIEALSNPSYLSNDFIQKIPPKQQVAMSTIVSGGSELRQIKTNKEVIVAEKISKALDIYLSKNKHEQNAIKLIIVGENAPYTSHEATTFRSNNKPVMFVRDIVRAISILSSNSIRLADVQRGQLYLVDDFNESKDVVSNWLKHPVPEEVSVHHEFLNQDMTVIAIEDVNLKNLSINELIKLIRDEKDPYKAKMAVFTIRALLLKRIALEENRQETLKTFQKETNPMLISQLKAVYRDIKYATEEILLVLQNHDRLQRLYPVNFLAALIAQTPMDSLVVQPESIASLLKNEIIESGTVNILGLAGKKFRDHTAQYAKIGDYALTEEVAKAFNNFLANFDQIENANEFARMIMKLAQLDILPMWLNSIFYPESQNNHSPKLLSKILVELFNKEKDFLLKISNLSKQVSSFPLNQLGNPKKFQETLEQWDEIARLVYDEKFLTEIAKASPLGKIASLAFVNQFVKIFDEGIKNFTASKLYASKIKKAEDMGKILYSYFSPLRYFACTFIGNIDDINNEFVVSQTVKNYLTNIITLIDNSLKRAKDSEDQAHKELLPSSFFNVAAAKLGSKGIEVNDIARGGNLKYSLEDIFTLIHQNLLVIINRMMISLPNNSIPSFMNSLKNELIELSIVEGDRALPPPSMIGTNLDKNELRFYFNQTLRNHSNSFNIAYSLRDKKTYFHVQYMGEARERWQFFANIIKHIFPHSRELEISEMPFVDQNRGLMTFAWQISKTQDISQAVAVLKILGDLSNSFDLDKVKKLIEHEIKIKNVNIHDGFLASYCQEELSILSADHQLYDYYYHVDLIEWLIEDYKENCKINIHNNLIDIIGNKAFKLADEDINKSLYFAYLIRQISPKVYELKLSSNHSFVKKIYDFLIERINKEAGLAIRDKYYNISEYSEYSKYSKIYNYSEWLAKQKKADEIRGTTVDSFFLENNGYDIKYKQFFISSSPTLATMLFKNSPDLVSSYRKITRKNDSFSRILMYALIHAYQALNPSSILVKNEDTLKEAIKEFFDSGNNRDTNNNLLDHLNSFTSRDI